MKKKIKALVLFGALVLVIGIGSVLWWIDRIARVAVETGATYALGVKTTLADMDVGVTTGSVSLSKLRITNPDGFDTPHFMDLSRGSVVVSLGSLMQETVSLPELKLGGLDINLERKGSSANYKTILNELKKFESGDSAASATAKAPNEKAPAGRKFVVHQVTIEDLSVTVNVLPFGGTVSRVPIVIPRIELRDVGSGAGGGIEMGKLVGIIMRAVLDAIVREGGGLIPADMAGELRDGIAALGNLGGVGVKVVGDVTTVVDGQVRKLGDLGAGTIKQLGEGAGTVGKELGDASKKIGASVGNLLQKKEKEVEPKKP